MKVLFLLLCFISSIIHAQVTYFSYDSAAVKLVETLPSKEPFDTAYKWRKAENAYIYIGSCDDVYDLFGYNVASQYKDFDFSSFHILGKSVCRQCEMYCDHHSGHTNCHRNRCQYSWVWAIRKNDQAFMEIPSGTDPGIDTAFFYSKKIRTYHDTVISHPSDIKRSVWLTHSQGDCMARFTFAVFRDMYYPVLLLKEWNQYGGCRAARFEQFTISFETPPGINQFIKQVIRIDKLEDVK